VRRHSPNEREQEQEERNPRDFSVHKFDEQILRLRRFSQNEESERHERERNAHDPQDQREIKHVSPAASAPRHEPLPFRLRRYPASRACPHSIARLGGLPQQYN
jgi:hypothetical protein